MSSSIITYTWPQNGKTDNIFLKEEGEAANGNGSASRS